jgi:hypothetical protein
MPTERRGPAVCNGSNKTGGKGAQSQSTAIWGLDFRSEKAHYLTVNNAGTPRQPHILWPSCVSSVGSGLLTPSHVLVVFRGLPRSESRLGILFAEVIDEGLHSSNHFISDPQNFLRADE